jgi:hypothetical protein
LLSAPLFMIALLTHPDVANAFTENDRHDV